MQLKASASHPVSPLDTDILGTGIYLKRSRTSSWLAAAEGAASTDVASVNVDILATVEVTAEKQQLLLPLGLNLPCTGASLVLPVHKALLRCAQAGALAGLSGPGLS